MKVWCFVGILFLLCVCGECRRFAEYQHEIKRGKKKSTALEKLSKGVSFVRKYHDLPKIPRIKSSEHMRAVAGGTGHFDPCKIVQLCQNGGACKSVGSNHYCECTHDYVGKNCEFLADKSHCDDNDCLNNSTCHSVSKRRKVITRELDDHLKVIEVDYECFCKYGYSGSFCEYSESMRACEQDRCFHSGIAHFVDGNCTCKCEENYFGDRCETMLPCLAFTCENGGTCVNERINGTDEFRAKCICLETEPRFLVDFAGEHCEILSAQKGNEKCYPCNSNPAVFKRDCRHSHGAYLVDEFLEKLIAEWSSGLTWNDNKDPFCLNGGTCLVRGMMDADYIVHVLPYCKCRGVDEGHFCETHVVSPCDPTSIDNRTAEEKCGAHGVCVAKTATSFTCECAEGWAGDKCDISDPCSQHRCTEGSLCVPVPIERLEEYSLAYTCLCEMNQEADFSGSEQYVKCTQTDFGPCAKSQGKCKNNAKCYPCGESDKLELKLCSEEEKRRGFRCLCPAGYLPPFCAAQADSCHNHRCMNAATCVVDDDNIFSYRCICREGFKGEFCEISASPCTSIGLEKCIMGVCMPDEGTARGFSCRCLEGFEGVNCDLPIEFDFLSYLQRHYWWTYPLIMTLFMTPLVVIFTKIAEHRAQRVYELMVVEKKKFETRKAAKGVKRPTILGGGAIVLGQTRGEATPLL